MQEVVTSPLDAWGNFYVIVGSSAGALTGLQFVVITLIAQTRSFRGTGESISAFGTPNVVHFCAALIVSAILSVPWKALWHAGVAIAVCGALGDLYSAIVIRRARRQTVYQPVFEDWLWHAALPVVAYSALVVAGSVLWRNSADLLLAIGAASLLLVLIGIHNAWDTVTYLTVGPGAAEVGGSGEATAARSDQGPVREAADRGTERPSADVPTPR